MHMADALVSPAVGGAMWAVSSVAVAWSSSRLKHEADDRKVPLMGVLGAFIFAIQMVNFAIPGTGSSGHLGGGILLAVLLGQHASLLVMASVLLVQALFFADGGLLALGCNIFNMGVIPAYLVYPLIFRNIAGSSTSKARISAAIILSSVVTLQLGPLAVVLETMLSGISSLPCKGFLILMLPIHLPIGIVEGVVTAAIISMLREARPDMFGMSQPASMLPSLRTVVASFAVAAVIAACGLSLLASKNPDGLEWAVSRITGSETLAGAPDSIRASLAGLQEKTSFLPDYSFKKQPDAVNRPETSKNSEIAGTSLSGLVGGAITLLLLSIAAFALGRGKTAP